MNYIYLLTGIFIAMGVLSLAVFSGSNEYMIPLRGETKSDVGPMTYDENVKFISIIKSQTYEKYDLQYMRE